MTGLYVHIPFCPSICYYCDFTVWKANNRHHERLVSCIKEEALQRYKKNTEFKTLYFGGGTPSILNLGAFKDLMVFLHTYFNLDSLKEFTLEANPGTITCASLETYKEYALTRLSLGIQTFDQNLRRQLGRHTPLNTVKESLKLIKSTNLDLNIDLMFGIPNQKRINFTEDINTVMDFEPSHISLYGLTYEPGTLYHQWLKLGKLSEVSSERYNRMYQYASRRFQTNNFHRYEVSNFARPGKESVHNQGYWNHSEYYGLGPGAHSFINNYRIANPSKFPDYEKWVYSGCKGSKQEALSQETLYNECIWLGLRTIKGICPRRLSEKFGIAPDKITLDKWINSGYIKKNKDHYYLDNEGWLFLDEISVSLINNSKKTYEY